VAALLIGLLVFEMPDHPAGRYLLLAFVIVGGLIGWLQERESPGLYERMPSGLLDAWLRRRRGMRGRTPLSPPLAHGPRHERECPSCGATTRGGLILCPQCGALINPKWLLFLALAAAVLFVALDFVVWKWRGTM
jgi:hypothetical protein